ncbi:hypothetical protein A1Q1_05469 [Trichosporon asahii var. asahii CBS 2479]|uniref:Major facilitator superfamily (MFS) profile domain-containing protein n=1 Tax=Trichosporon asahii var. asahii (strain ATCC 90039 / CBS 2479 / JCM 2466 / KCTC 7840 / NBRC 103889/ NCYC 2677 / UAMH 7654) TaxID=1186058 RepID=J6F5E5_TRIAS|nr:hypothetical protein A1Q1_05469 [Trichosporon asahii var. asahii CBS 2479]EJT52259.1 hypothetical protein A1Q1_05469 [Trichosporon asahii var. asahii CBS 2479]
MVSPHRPKPPNAVPMDDEYQRPEEDARTALLSPAALSVLDEIELTDLSPSSLEPQNTARAEGTSIPVDAYGQIDTAPAYRADEPVETERTAFHIPSIVVSAPLASQQDSHASVQAPYAIASVARAAHEDAVSVGLPPNQAVSLISASGTNNAEDTQNPRPSRPSTFLNHTTTNVSHNEPPSSLSVGLATSHYIASDSFTDVPIDPVVDHASAAENTVSSEATANPAVAGGSATTVELRLPEPKWNGSGLALLYISCWLLNATDAFQNSTVTNVSPFITSELGGHSFSPTVFVVVDCCISLAAVFTAKLPKVVNRFYLHASGAVIATVGLAMLSTSTTLIMYSIASIIYSVGWVAIYAATNSLLLEATDGTHISIIRAFNSSPALLTTLVGSPLAQNLTKDHWRWCYGSLAITMNVLCICTAFMHWSHWCHTHTRDQQPTAQPPSRERNDVGRCRRSWSSKLQFFPQAHVISGPLFFLVGSNLLLVSFSAAESASETWKSGYIIGMITGGCVLLAAFAAVQWAVPNPFIPLGLLKDRMMLGAFAVSAWSGYYTSYLQLVFDRSVAEAGWIAAIPEGMEAIAEVAIAFVADKFGHPRALLVTAFLLFCLGVNLMMLFRDPDTPLYRVIGPQFLIGAAVASFNLLTSFVVASQPEEGPASPARAPLHVRAHGQGGGQGALSRDLEPHPSTAAPA